MTLASRASAKASPLWLLALITLNGTLAMRIFVPALPAVARDLHASAAAATVGIVLVTAGLVAQLCFWLAQPRLEVAD